MDATNNTMAVFFMAFPWSKGGVQLITQTHYSTSAVAINKMGVRESESGPSLERFESLFYLALGSLVACGDCCSDSLAVGVTRFFHVSSSREHSSEMIVRSDVAGVARDHFLKVGSGL